MALFGGKRDISLFNSINKELINDIIQTEVGYYKFALTQTETNVYGESPGKHYYEPVRIACLVDKQDQTWSTDDFGSDVTQTIDFSFLKQELRDIDLVPEVGDILLWANNFFEVHGKIETQYILGKDPDYAISTGTVDYGSSHSIKLSSHISTVEKLNLIPLRGGKYPDTHKGVDSEANKIVL